MSSKGKQRACLCCSLVQSAAAFRKGGCPNCELLEMKGSIDRVMECTTGQLDGAIAVIQPKESWVAKFQRIDNFVAGVYAAKLTGSLSAEDIELMEEKGYHNRAQD